MRKLFVLLLALCLCLSVSALADEVVLNAAVVAEGATVNSITVVSDAIAPTTVNAKFNLELMVTSGWGPNAVTEAVAKPIYSACWEPDGSVTLAVDAFGPKTAFTLTYTIPATEGAEEQVLGSWTNADVTNVKYAVIDNFITDTYTGTYKDAAGNDAELSIVYRLYIPAVTENVPMVMTQHGSGESGNDGIAHVTASQIASCWAEPAWQAEHPCYVVAAQWPNSDMSNNLEERDAWLAVYHDMYADLIAKYQPSKTYLATLSMGSRLGFRYLTLYPNEFDAALMCCGAMQNADLSAVTDKPVWLVHCVSDMVNASQNSMDAYNQMVAAGNKNVHLTIVTNEGMHGVFNHAVWQQVFNQSAYMDWLFQQ